MISMNLIFFQIIVKRDSIVVQEKVNLPHFLITVTSSVHLSEGQRASDSTCVSVLRRSRDLAACLLSVTVLSESCWAPGQDTSVRKTAGRGGWNVESHTFSNWSGRRSSIPEQPTYYKRGLLVTNSVFHWGRDLSELWRIPSIAC